MTAPLLQEYRKASPRLRVEFQGYTSGWVSTLLAMACALGILSLLGLMVLGWRVHHFGRRDQARPAGAIVMLGARVLPDGAPSASLQARAVKSAELYLQGLAPRVLFSGGVKGGAPAEARLARAIAVAAGIPEAACLIEVQSQTTDDNASFSAKILLGEGIREVVLVSDGFHLFRACRTFARHGVRAHPSPASLEGRRWGWRDTAYWTTREVLALAIRPQLWLA